MTTPTTIYTTHTLGQDNAIDHIIDAMQSYDPTIYRTEIANGNLDQLVNEEWDNVWTQGDNTYPTREAAEADHADANPYPTILEITRDDVREALQRAFGDQ